MSQCLEWASVTPGLVVVATEQGQWFLHRPPPLFLGDPFLVPMSEVGTKTTARGLLEGAIGAGMAQSSDVLPEPAPFTPTMLVYTLASSYHTTRRTPATFRIAARRAGSLGRRDLADFLERKARHETGHDRLALQDLRALGLPADRLVEALKPRTAFALTRWFEASAQADSPAACLGYTYCLERLALLRGRAEIAAVHEISPPGVNATRFLRVHSSLGSDATHVEELVEFVAALPASDRIVIAQTAYETAVLMARHVYQDPATVNSEIDAAFREIDVALPQWLRAGGVLEPAQESEASTDWASCKSEVPKPSVNQA